jgi:hypothetical protein
MRNSFVSWLTAAVIAFGFPIAGLNTANAQSVMRTCASEWKQAQAAGTTGGQPWPQFLAQCRTRQGSAAAPPSSTAAPAPAPQSGSLFPWSQPSAPTSAAASNVGAPSTGQSVMRLCASQWKDAKAAGTTGGLSWPQFLSQCRARQGSAAAPPSGGFAPPPAAAPAPPPAPASQSGSLFPWWQQSAPSSAPAPNVGAPAALQAGQYTTEVAARARCPSDTVVWVNTPTRIYHYSGTRYYGHTLKGGYMCEADARSAGYRAARNRQREAEAHSG